MKCNQSNPKFELVSPCPFPTTATIRPRIFPNSWRATYKEHQRQTDIISTNECVGENLTSIKNHGLYDYTPHTHMAKQKQDDRPELTYSSYAEAMNDREKWRARHDDDDIKWEYSINKVIFVWGVGIKKQCLQLHLFRGNQVYWVILYHRILSA